ncbi:MAG: hypothetical protein AAGU75_01410 [Bacillota bacterium]
MNNSPLLRLRIELASSIDRRPLLLRSMINASSLVILSVGRTLAPLPLIVPAALALRIADVLGRGVEQGEFDTGLSIDDLTKHFVMAIRGLVYEWCIRYPDFDLRGQALAHFKILLDGISAKNR